VTEGSNANRSAVAALAVVMLTGAAIPAAAANASFNVGVDIAGVYQDVTRFSVACLLTEGASLGPGRVDKVQLLRDLIGGKYVGRWKDTLTISFPLRGNFHFNQPGGSWWCKLYFDDQSGTPVGNPVQTITGNFPLTYLGQFTYRGRPPAIGPKPTPDTNNGGGFGGMGNSKLHVFKP